MKLKDFIFNGLMLGIMLFIGRFHYTHMELTKYQMFFNYWPMWLGLMLLMLSIYFLDQVMK